MNTTDYSKCALCGDWAVGGITLSVTTPSKPNRAGRTVTRHVCPQCTETIKEM